MPKKILQINKYYDPWIGGIETVVKQIAEGLKHDYEMSILVCDDRIPNQQAFEKITVVKTKTLGEIFSMPISLEFFKLFKKMAQQNDIIHIHHPFPLAVLAVFLFREHLKNKKIVVTYHSDIVRTKILGFFYKPLLLWFLQRVNQVATTSPRLRDNSRILSRFKEKISIIPLGIDFRENQTEETRQDYILFVGRLVGYKGLEYLIQALPGTNEKLKIAGTGPLESSLKQLTKSLALENQIEFLGRVADNDLAKFYKQAKVFVLPSIGNNEAFGIVQLEAMAYGLPIINTSLPTGVPWVARNALEAITVSPRNSNELREAILRLSASQKLRKSMGSCGKKRLEETFLLNNLIQAYDQLYKKLLQ